MTTPSYLRDSPGLLVSVRNGDEAEIAVAAGADLIDVKEPSLGSLGKADDATIAAVVRQVAGRRPVSCAMDELRQLGSNLHAIRVEPGVALVKFGLAGFGGRPDWAEQVLAVRERVEDGTACRVVAVAYADWRRAESPHPEEVVDFARNHRCVAFLIDTWRKDGSTLLDWINLSELTEICRYLHAARIPVALAGTLGRPEIADLLPLKPDWFAVRGAACEGDGRTGTVVSERIRRLVALIHSHA